MEGLSTKADGAQAKRHGPRLWRAGEIDKKNEGLMTSRHMREGLVVARGGSGGAIVVGL